MWVMQKQTLAFADVVELVYTGDLKSPTERYVGSSPTIGIMNWDDGSINPMDDIRRFTCAHSLRTEPDENGDAICLRCNSVIQVRFNLERFKEDFKNIGKNPYNTGQ